MSVEIEAAPVAEDDARSETDKRTAKREYAVDIAVGSGRTIDLRVVPFGEVVTVADGLGGVPKGVPYREEFMPGAFADQIRGAKAGRARHVYLNFEHQPGLQGVIGHGTALREASDGYHASFDVLETPDGDKALYLVDKGILGGASSETYFQKSIRSAAGVVQRVKAHLDAVALCRTPAYSMAVVTGRREAEDLLLDEVDLPLPFDPELAERMAAMGLAVPDSLKAHPATGTPATAGTPLGGTRQDGERQTELEE